ncbi:hypothetical protein JMUB7522_27240 [Staphylococcus aureus]
MCIRDRSKGDGYQDFEKGIKNTPNTMFLIGSAQKFSTGLLLKQLEEEHKICLLYTSPSPRDYAASRMPSSA